VRLTIPFDIRVIQIGTDCSILQPIHSLADSTTFLDYHQYYLDDLHLLPTKDFPFIYIQPQVGSNCNVLPVLTTPLIANASYQWYKDSIAIKDETGNVYNVTGTKEKSNYNVRVTTGVNCVVSEPFLVVASKLNVIQIPADTTLCNKDSNVLIAPAFEGIIYTVNAVRSNEVRVNKAGMYDITATDAIGCERHFVVQVSKTNCDSCAPFIPTAFTPNNDGLNDIFRPTFNCRVNDFGVIIFNRWGQKVFESSDVNQGWDGTYQGKRLSPGLYVYTIHYNTISKIKKTVKGTVLFVQ
jgi:gliding motility-associated-like protein